MSLWDKGKSIIAKLAVGSGGISNAGALTNTGNLAVTGTTTLGGGTALVAVTKGTVAVDPDDAVSGDEKVSDAVTVTGVAVGDLVFMVPPSDLEDDLIPAGAVVTDADEVTVYLYANAVVNGASKTWSYLWIDLT